MTDTRQDAVLDFSPLEKRVADIRAWLNRDAPECFAEQRHCAEGTQERIYWHYGYAVAVLDVLRWLERGGTK